MTSSMTPLTPSGRYDALTARFPNHAPRPLVGISGNFGPAGCELAEGYYRSVELAGGVPVVLPPSADAGTLLGWLDRLDGLLLSGGADINPLLLGEEPVPALGAINPRRDDCELLLVRLAHDRGLPLFGICRGVQVLAAALGGTVVQDLATALPGAGLVKHSQDAPRHVATHTVCADEGSLVARLLGREFAVNSFHHQAVGEPGPHLAVTARSADGVAEAVESTDMKPVVGVQWHPECFAPAGLDAMRPLFDHFVERCAAYRRARRLHDRILTLDSHCDTPMHYGRGARLEVRRPDVLMDLHRMAEGGLDAVVMAAYLPQGELTPEGHAEARRLADSLLAAMRAEVERNAACAVLASTPEAVRRAKRAGLRAVLPAVENGYALGTELGAVEHFARQGVVYITLCHNGDNALCDSARRSRATHGGLSDLGRRVVDEMQRLGVMVDLSHAAESTFHEVLDRAAAPVVCSHSSARALCNHPRNLTDEQLRRLAQAGGVAQATFYAGFLREEGRGEATLLDAVAHIRHMVSVAGIDHVGIGSDFDGDGGVRGLASAADYLQLTQCLLAEGFTPDDLAKLYGGNFLRVMEACQRRRDALG